MEVDDNVPKLPLDLPMLHSLTGGRYFCTQTHTKYCIHDVHRILECLLLASDVAQLLTLCLYGITDGTRVTQAICISCSNQEQIDSTGLQVFQHVALSPHVLSYSVPATARGMTTGDTIQHKQLTITKQQKRFLLLTPQLIEV